MGLTSNLTDLAGLDITIINVTDVSDGIGRSKHFTAATSPLIISLFTRRRVMRELLLQNLGPDALGGFGNQTVVEQVREIRL